MKENKKIAALVCHWRGKNGQIVCRWNLDKVRPLKMLEPRAAA